MKKINTLVQSIWYGQNSKFSICNYCKLATVIIACLAGRNMAVAQNTSNIEEEYYTFVVNAPEIKIPEEVTINGYVKDEAGMPLANATIKSDYGEELLTDSNGVFSFKLKKERVAAQNIYASYNGLVTGVRSYHPSMENTTYTITLYKPAACCCKIKKCDGVDFKAFNINFKTNNSSLSEATKKELDAIANSLKECPETNIYLTVHVVKSKSLQKLAIIQVNAIKNYLVEQDGIVTDRISAEEVIGAVGNNSIDVTAR